MGYALCAAGCGPNARYIILAPPTQKQSKINEQTIRVKSPQPKLVVGEKLTYSVFWTGISVGTATLHIKEITKINDRDTYHIIGRLVSNNFLSKIYKFDDKMETYLDTQDLVPIKFEKNVSEGPKYRKHQIIEFDHVNNVAKEINPKDNSVKTVGIAKNAQDSLSVGYFFRLQNGLKTGDALNIQVNEGEKNWDLEIKVLGVQNIEVGKLGKFDAFCVEPKAAHKGKKLGKGKIWVWFSCDERRLPLVAKIQALVGSIGLCLEKIETVQ